jgi:hypothetical protein
MARLKTSCSMAVAYVSNSLAITAHNCYKRNSSPFRYHNHDVFIFGVAKFVSYVPPLASVVHIYVMQVSPQNLRLCPRTASQTHSRDPSVARLLTSRPTISSVALPLLGSWRFKQGGSGRKRVTQTTTILSLTATTRTAILTCPGS